MANPKGINQYTKTGSPVARRTAAKLIRKNRSILRSNPGMFPGAKAGYKSEITRTRNKFKAK